MGLFDGIRASQAIATLAATPPNRPDAAAAAGRLRAIGAAAVPKLIEALPGDQYGSLGRALAELVDNSSLTTVVKEGLLSDDPQVVVAVKRALIEAKQTDPNRILDLYIGRGGSPEDIADILLARKDALSGKSVMRLLDFTKEQKSPALLKLIDQLATDAVVPALLGFLKSAEWEGRCQIAQTLSRFPSEPVRDALVQLLEDPNKMVRQAALDAVGALGMPVPVGPVCKLLRDPDLMVQTKAIETAVKLDDPGSVRHLLEILQDESEHARRAAVEVLNAVGNPNAIKDLLFALKDKDWWVRVRAADALGAIGGPKVIDAVLQLLGDEDEFMRRAAVEILNTTKDERAFQHLVRALRDPDWWVRERAIDALANLGDKRAVPELASLLRDDGQATPVAIRALAQLGDPAAVEPILGKLQSTDDSIQREAIEALGSLATAQHAEHVAQALRGLDPASAEAREAAQRIAAELDKLARSRTGLTRPGTARQAAPSAMRTLHAKAIPGTPQPSTEEPTVEMATEVFEPGDAKASPESPAGKAAAAAVEAVRRAGDETIDFSSLQTGQVLGGRYKIIKELGRGGFGTVLRVEDQVVGEEIALKLIHPQLVQDDSTIARFIHEVRYARKITHENVIRIHDFLMLGTCYALSMEYFASQPLARRMRRGLQQHPALALKFVRDIACGMQVAHQADIVHRDLKPANILVNDADLLKIVDFGLAAACSQTDSRVTKTGHLVGTPTYMSPEQARGLPSDARTDIYSLGVIMYEIFTGTPPYSGDNPLSVLFQHLEGKKEAPRLRNASISEPLESVILKAMAVSPNDRYQNALDLIADLDALHVLDAA